MSQRKRSFWQTYKRLVIGVALLSTLVFALRTLPIPDCSTIQSSVSEWGVLAPIVYCVVYVIATIAFVPGVLVTLFGGLAFGALWGTVLVLLSATVGAILAFLIARYVARDTVERFLSKQPWFAKFKAGLAENGLSFVLFTRLVPIFPFNGLNYASGLIPLTLRDYALGSLIGMLPGTFAYVYLGATGCALIDPIIQGKGVQLPPDVRMKLIIALSLLAALSVLPVVLKKIRQKRAAPV